MTDKLEKLKAAFEATRPEQDPAARQRAVDAALREFDAENATAAQGSAEEDRQSGGRASLLARLFGGRSMQLSMPRLTPALMGGASAAVIAIAVLASRDMPRELAREKAPAELQSASTKTEADRNNRVDGNETAALAPRAEPKRDSLADLRESPANSGIAGGSATSGRLILEEGSRAFTDGRTGETSLFSQQKVAESEALPSAPPATVMKQAAEDRISILPVPDMPVQPGYQDQGRDNFQAIASNPVKVTAEEPTSTFSIDVDTASYSFLRGEIMRGVLPQKDAVRIEEMINYFPYDYAGPESRETPFLANVQVIPTPWNADTKLMRIGIKGYALSEAEKPRSNLVFLIDTSGSMQSPDKLPLLVNSFKLLLDSLDPDDTVAIVTYAGSAGTVLEPTKVSEAGKILAALEQLYAGGSTAGAEGIRQAYRLAEQNYDPAGVNRVILATDGDFNVGITDMDELKGFIERKRDTGVLLSVLGFGHGNLNDALMQTLAQNGNGQAAYIDSLSEARKTLVEEAGSTLFPIAKDVKIQVELNPATVAEYRLIGYETRLLARENFNNDKIDAGEIGSGHTVTALYEITPAGSPARLVDSLRYQRAATPQGATMEAQPGEAQSGEYAFVKIRYKAPDGEVSKLITTPVGAEAEIAPESTVAQETRFAAAVAAFGQLLRGGRYLGSFSYDEVAALAQGAKGDDPFGYRAEFINLVRLAKSAAAMEPLKQ